MLLSLFRIESFKLYRQAVLWVSLALLAALIIFIYASIFLVQLAPLPDMPDEARSQLRAFLTWPQAWITATGFASGNGLGGLVMIVLVGVVVAQEYASGVLSQWLVQGAPRRWLLLAKLGALFSAIAVVALVPILAGGLLSGFFTICLSGSLNLEAIDFVQLAISPLRSAYTLLPYIALAIALAVFSRSVVATIGGGLAYALLLEAVASQLFSLAGGPLARLASFAPNMLAASLINLNQAISRSPATAASGMPKQVLLPPGQAAGFIALYTIILLGLAVWRFQHQDLAA